MRVTEGDDVDCNVVICCFV